MGVWCGRAGEETPGGGAKVFAEQHVNEEVGGAVDAHQKVAGVDDELNVDVPIGVLKKSQCSLNGIKY